MSQLIKGNNSMPYFNLNTAVAIVIMCSIFDSTISERWRSGVKRGSKCYASPRQIRSFQKPEILNDRQQFGGEGPRVNEQVKIKCTGSTKIDGYDFQLLFKPENARDYIEMGNTYSIGHQYWRPGTRTEMHFYRTNCFNMFTKWFTFTIKADAFNNTEVTCFLLGSLHPGQEKLSLCNRDRCDGVKIIILPPRTPPPPTIDGPTLIPVLTLQYEGTDLKVNLETDVYATCMVNVSNGQKGHIRWYHEYQHAFTPFAKEHIISYTEKNVDGGKELTGKMKMRMTFERQGSRIVCFGKKVDVYQCEEDEMHCKMSMFLILPEDTGNGDDPETEDVPKPNPYVKYGLLIMVLPWACVLVEQICPPLIALCQRIGGCEEQKKSAEILPPDENLQPAESAQPVRRALYGYSLRKADRPSLPH